MKTGVPVVIATGMDRGRWLTDCLGSIQRDRLTICRSRTGGELGAIRMIYRDTHWPRWLLLQDSCVVLDQGLFDLVDEVDGPLLVAPRPCMYLAVYERRVLDVVGIPDAAGGADRELAIRYECEWIDQYVDAAVAMGYKVPVLFPDLTDGNARGVEERHGRQNLVLENGYLRKYKGTWR